MTDEAMLTEAEAVLNKIANEMGRVCDEFELCSHPACQDSCGAVLAALNYFRKYPEGRISNE